MLTTAAALVFGLNSCNYKAATVVVEYGWDEGDTYLTLGNMNAYAYLFSDMITELDKSLESNGFIISSGSNFIYSQNMMTEKAALNTLNKIVSEVNPDKYEKETIFVMKDFVIRFKLADSAWTEVYRKNIAKN